MKKIYYLAILLGLLMACKKDSEPTSQKSISQQVKPIKLEAIVPESQGVSGMKFMGRVLHLNEEKIIEHGFLLQEQDPFNPGLPIRLKIDKKIQIGPNELLYANIPKTGVNYTAKYYIKTDKQEYLSGGVTFRYVPVKLEPFAERSVHQGDVISINGDFSKIDDSYYVLGLTLDPIAYEISADKKTLRFTIDGRFNHGDEPIFTLVKNNTMPIYLGRVNVLAKLLPLDNFMVNYREMITFGALGFKYDSKKPFEIIVGSNSFSLKTGTQSYVSDLVKNLKGNSFKFGYYDGIDTVYFPTPLKLDPPNVNDVFFREKVTHPNSSLRLSVYGLNQKMPLEKSKITLGNYTAIATANWNGEDWLTVSDIPEGNYGLKFVSDYFTYTPTDKITIRKLNVGSFSPKELVSTNYVTITGNFIDGKTYRIYSNIGMSPSSPAANGSINVYLDESLADKFEIKKVGYYDDILKKETLVDVSFSVQYGPITYSHFSPSTGNYNTKITLYGEGISRGMIFFDGKWMPADEVGLNQVSFYPYMVTLPGKYKIAVFHKNKWLTVDQTFEFK